MSSNFWKRIESKANRNANKGDGVCAGIRQGIQELSKLQPKHVTQDIMAECVVAHGAVIAEIRDRMSCSLSVLSQAKPDDRYMARALAAADDAVYDRIWKEVRIAGKIENTLNNLGAAFPEA